MSKQEEILKELCNAVVEYQVETCRDAAHLALELGIDPILAIMEGLARGMERVRVLYDSGEYFVPEVLLCAESLYAGLDVFCPYLKKAMDRKPNSIVIGCVQGDVHDIGKNLVKVMFDTAGWQVHDLGCDVPYEVFVETQIRTRAKILAMSAMMTTTMMGIKRVIQMVRAQRLDCLILIGGAPVTWDIAALFGADGYADSAATVVTEGLRMIARSEQFRQEKMSASLPSVGQESSGQIALKNRLFHP